MQHCHRPDRRRFVKQLLALGAVTALSPAVRATASISVQRPLNFYHTHTGERLQVDYDSRGLSPASLDELNHFLRTGEKLVSGAPGSAG